MMELIPKVPSRTWGDGEDRYGDEDIIKWISPSAIDSWP
jgi:hypothetical protein